MTMLASQITSLTVVYSIVYSGVHQRKHQSSASLAFVREIHRGPVNFPHKWPVTRKMFPFDDVIMWMIPYIMYQTGPFKFRWAIGHIYYSSYYHHQVGSINLSHCCHIFLWLCAWSGCTIITCRFHVYPGKAGFWVFYHCEVLRGAQIIENRVLIPKSKLIFRK